MWLNQIKANCRKIHTGLKGSKMLSVIQSVEGQLSDGMWENSFAMRGYWLFECCDLEGDDVVIYISKAWGDVDFNRPRCNKFCGMDEQQIKEWFANKVKQIIKQEIKDDYTEGLEWSRKCKVESAYMHDGITAQDAYKAYDCLKDRSNILWYGIK